MLPRRVCWERCWDDEHAVLVRKKRAREQSFVLLARRVEVARTRVLVYSHSGNGYVVTLPDNLCTCPDAQGRRFELARCPCKHVYWVLWAQNNFPDELLNTLPFDILQCIFEFVSEQVQ
jgi:predicted nucleic acid-binding Zn finger protein